MTDKRRERLRRPVPERTEPIRDLFTLLRAGARPDAPHRRGAADHDRPHSATPDGDWGEYIDYCVRTGYDVASKNIQQGRRIAESMNDRRYEVNDMSNDLQEAVQRMWRMWFDWFDLTARMTGQGFRGRPASPGQRERDHGRHRDDRPSYPWERDERAPGWYGDRTENNDYESRDKETTPWRDRWSDDDGRGREYEPMGSAEPEPATESGRLRVSIAVESKQPTSVSFDLRPGSLELPLATHGLRALDASQKPIEDVHFEPASDGSFPRVRIIVPDDWPPGLYTGAVLDATTGVPQGWLSVRVDSPGD